MDTVVWHGECTCNRRILHCIPSLGMGGTERRLSYLARELAMRGFGSHIAYIHGGVNLVALQGSGVNTHPLYATSNYDPRILLQLVSLIRRLEPDIVHTWLTQMDIFGAVASLLTHRPFVLSEVSSEDAYPKTWKNLLRLRLATSARAVVSNSAGGDAYWQRRVPRQQRYLIPNGLPLTEISSVRPATPASLGVTAGQQVVLFAGRFDPAKNVSTLIRAIAEGIPDDRVISIFCGDGPDRAAGELLASQLGITRNLRFPGFVRDVWPIMKFAAVFVSVSIFEGRPNAVIEAMACGCPIVVSDIPAHREFLDESEAIFVDPYDHVAIARAVRSVLADPVGARNRALKAKEKTMDWSWPQMVQRYIEVYNDVLQ